MTSPRPTRRPTRRRFLLATLGVSAAATGLGIGWSLMPPRQRLVPSQPLPSPEGQRAFNGWLRIGLDDRVTVMVPKSEMGQGVLTGLAMVLADELDADWARVSRAPAAAPPSPTASCRCARQVRPPVSCW